MRLFRCIFCWMLLLPGMVHAQFTNNNWCFGDSAGLAFDSMNLFKSSSAVKRGTASISNELGELLFYGSTADVYSSFTGQLQRGRLFNKNHNLLFRSDSIVGIGWYHDMLILPKSTTDSTFYVFTAGVSIPDTGLWYSIVDLKLQGGLGQVVQKNIRFETHPVQDMLTAVKHGNGKGWWLITRRWRSLSPNDEFWVNLVDSVGIHPLPVQHVGLIHTDNSGDMSFNKLGDQLALCGWGNYIGLFDFDRCTGLITNETLIETNGAPSSHPFRYYTSVVFSSDGSKLYVNSIQQTYQTSGKLYQFDLNASNIPASRILIDSFPVSAANSGMELGPDGKIYISCVFDSIGSTFPYSPTLYTYINNNLSVINYPDSLGVACDFQPFSFNLGAGRTYYGLPNNPDYELGAWVGSPCDTLSVGLNPNPIPEASWMQAWYNHEWNMIHVNAAQLKGKKGMLRLFDMEGRIVFEKPAEVIAGGYYTTEINMENLASGVYVVNLVTEQDKISGKVGKY